MANVDRLRQQRQQLNQQINQGQAANPRLQGRVDAINQKIQGQRNQPQMPNQGMEQMPNMPQGPQAWGNMGGQMMGAERMPQGQGQMYGAQPMDRMPMQGGQAWANGEAGDPNHYGMWNGQKVGTMMGRVPLGFDPKNLGAMMGGGMSGAEQLPPMNGPLGNFTGSGQGQAPDQGPYGWGSFGAPNAGAMRPNYNSQGPQQGQYGFGSMASPNAGAVRPSYNVGPKPAQNPGMMGKPPINNHSQNGMQRIPNAMKQKMRGMY